MTYCVSVFTCLLLFVLIESPIDNKYLLKVFTIMFLYYYVIFFHQELNVRDVFWFPFFLHFQDLFVLFLKLRITLLLCKC